jgi:hypothetical protein
MGSPTPERKIAGYLWIFNLLLLFFIEHRMRFLGSHGTYGYTVLVQSFFFGELVGGVLLSNGSYSERHLGHSVKMMLSKEHATCDP